MAVSTAEALEVLQLSWRIGNRKLHQISEDLYYEQLGEVPPHVYTPEYFLCGEPWTTDKSGNPVYLLCAKIGNRCFAAYSTFSEALFYDFLLKNLPDDFRKAV